MTFDHNAMSSSRHASPSAYSSLPSSGPPATRLPPPSTSPHRSGTTSPFSEINRNLNPNKRLRSPSFSSSSPRHRISSVAPASDGAPGSNASTSSASVESASPPPPAIARSPGAEPAESESGSDSDWSAVDPREVEEAIVEQAKAGRAHAEWLRDRLEETERKLVAVEGELREAQAGRVAAEEEQAKVVASLVTAQAEADNARQAPKELAVAKVEFEAALASERESHKSAKLMNTKLQGDVRSLIGRLAAREEGCEIQATAFAKGERKLETEVAEVRAELAAVRAERDAMVKMVGAAYVRGGGRVLE